MRKARPELTANMAEVIVNIRRIVNNSLTFEIKRV